MSRYPSFKAKMQTSLWNRTITSQNRKVQGNEINLCPGIRTLAFEGGTPNLPERE